MSLGSAGWCGWLRDLLERQQRGPGRRYAQPGPRRFLRARGREQRHERVDVVEAHVAVAVACGKLDGELRIWDAATPPDALVLPGNCNESTVAFDPAGGRVTSCGGDGLLRLWDADTGEQLAAWPAHEGPVRGLAWSPDGRVLVSGSGDRCITVWDPDTGRRLQTLAGHTDLVNLLALSPNGDYLLSHTWTGETLLWDFRSGHLLGTVQAAGPEAGIAFSPDSRRMAVISAENRAVVRRVPDGSVLLELATGDQPAGVLFDPADRWIVTTSWNRELHVWDAHSGALLRTLPLSEGLPTGLAFTPAGDRLALGSTDGTVTLWDVTHWAPVLTLRGISPWVNNLAFDASGRRLACASSIGRVWVWDRTSPRTRAAQVRALRRASEPVAPPVDAWCGAGASTEEVAAKLAAMAELSEPIRAASIHLARSWCGWPQQLAARAWDLLLRADASEGEIRLASSTAWALQRFAPDEARLLTTLGLARYRQQRPADALAYLLRGARLMDASDARTRCTNLACTVLVQRRLGHADDARAALAELKAALAPDPASSSAECWLIDEALAADASEAPRP